MSIEDTILAIRKCLSLARVSRFEAAVTWTDPSDFRAIALYAWNARVSAAMLAPLHICEVALRNAVSEALEQVYGPRWPWERLFELSLPNPRIGYSPRRDLISARSGQLTTGKVIPELKFVFWQKMFTSRNDTRLWTPYLRQVLPNSSPAKTVAQIRQEIYRDLEQTRQLRNRIAHHEPIFARNLGADLERLAALIELRDAKAAAWMMKNQEAAAILQEPRTRPDERKTSVAAYYHWLGRSGLPGDASADWCLAEKEVLGLL